VTQHCTASLLLLMYLLHAVGMYIIAGQSLSRIISIVFIIFVGQDNVCQSEGEGRSDVNLT